MPLTPAAGPVSLAQEALGRSLAACPAFQSFVGAASAAAALLRIHHDEVLPEPAGDEYTLAELEAIRPYALIATARQGTFRLTRTATGVYVDSGKLHLALVRDVTATELIAGNAELIRVFQNQFGVILTELAGLSDSVSDAYLIIQDLLVIEHFRAHEDDVPKLGNYVVASVDLLWGRSG